MAHNFIGPLKKDGYKVRAEGEPDVFGQRGTERLKYFCLPDTVDPRGPKVK